MANPTNSTKSNTQLSNLSLDAADLWLLNRIAESELLTEGAPLTTEARELMLSLWRETYDELGADRFSEAFRMALANTSFRVKVAEIRKFAGLRVDPPRELEARAALRWIIENMRYHGKKFGRAWCRKDGKRAMLAGSQRPKDADIDAEGIPSPDLPEATERALCEIGMGSLQSGLDFVWQHPGLDSVRDGDPEGTMRQREGEKIEKRWVEAFLRSE